MNDRRTLILPAKAAVAIAIAGGVSGFAYLTGNGTAVMSATVISVCGATVLAGILVLGSDESTERLQERLAAKPLHVFAIVSVLLGLFVVYTIGTGTARIPSVAGMAVYLLMPFLLLAGGRKSSRVTWPDAVAILWLWLPIELGLVRKLLLSSTPSADFHYGFAQGLAINTGIIAFAGWRCFPGIGYRFQFERKLLSAALKAFLMFAIVAIPLGFAIHFIRYSFELRKLAAAPVLFLGIFLFTAVPEEFLFRGLIQNWIERFAHRRNLSLFLASIIFGASHLNNGPPLPNYKYFVMASVAGIFYGLAWRSTGSLMASAMTHALVDTVWSVFFR